jgi:hypothetical protein
LGPIEIIFLILLMVFGIIGIVRGYGRELGVTTILLLVLFVLELLDERYRELLNRAVGVFVAEPSANPTRAWLYVIVLLVTAFMAYEGQTLNFPGNRGRIFFDLGTGLLNGYLLFGSVWYYLHQASWPALPVVQTYTPLYNALIRLMPPAIFSWPYFVGLVVLLLIARVWK